MIIKKAFTLIELIIAITIMVILTMTAYAPYSYYQNKAKLKVTTREISQLLYDSRNMAINGTIGSLGNVSIGVFFDNSNLWNNKIKVFSYPYDINNLDIKNIEGGNIKLLKILNLKKGVQIDNINYTTNLLFYFDAITGDTRYYSWAGGIKNIINSNNVAINISYKGSNLDSLNRTINYFTNTNIIDY